jgi:hypothetical protein
MGWTIRSAHGDRNFDTRAEAAAHANIRLTAGDDVRVTTPDGRRGSITPVSTFTDSETGISGCRFESRWDDES